MLNVAIFIGRRLSLKSVSGQSRGKHGAGVWIGVAGIALAMVIMIVSMAVVVGFKQEIRRKISGYNPQISVMPEGKSLDNVATETLTPLLSDAIRGAIPEAEITPSFELPCILKTDSAFAGVMFRGYVPEADVAGFIESSMISGKMPVDTAMQVALSKTTAQRLGVSAGESIYAHFFTDGNLRTRKIEISGVFDTHFTEYDGKVAFVPIELCRKINRSGPDTFTSLEVNGLEESDIPNATQRLSGALLQLTVDSRGTSVYTVSNILQAGAAYYNWLDLIDTNVVS
ncbi:MAG: ABC transporter permease [Paramuribaculum sp.]|nr:ABC transporter permease [Paramuribaculum sp.]